MLLSIKAQLILEIWQFIYIHIYIYEWKCETTEELCVAMILQGSFCSCLQPVRGPANERPCYIVTLSLTGWAHTQNDPCTTGSPASSSFVPHSDVTSESHKNILIILQSTSITIWMKNLSLQSPYEWKILAMKYLVFKILNLWPL